MLMLLPFPLWQQREVNAVEQIKAFLASVGASVVSYYVCKWLDKRGKGK